MYIFRRMAALLLALLVAFSAMPALAEGISPIRPYLDAIDGAATLDEMVYLDAQMLREMGVAALLGCGVTADLTDSTRHIVSFSAPSPTLDKNFYLNGTDAQKTAYLDYIAALFTLSGMDEAAARTGAERVYATEQTIAQQMLEPQDYGDVDKIYNLFTMDELQAIFPNAPCSRRMRPMALNRRIRSWCRTWARCTRQRPLQR